MPNTVVKKGVMKFFGERHLSSPCVAPYVMKRRAETWTTPGPGWTKPRRQALAAKSPFPWSRAHRHKPGSSVLSSGAEVGARMA